MKWLIASAATIAAAVYLARRNAAAEPITEDTGEPDQLTTTLEDIIVTINPTNYIPPAVSPDVASANVRAFLDMIAAAEGTNGANGYATAFGGGVIESLADHPRKFYAFSNSRGEQLRTSAAGRYQFLVKTWDALAARLQLPDFGPQSQDEAAIELIRERGALNDVQAGRTEAAIKRVAPIWASLPGAGYAQPERKLSYLVAQYRAAGGSLET